MGHRPTAKKGCRPPRSPSLPGERLLGIRKQGLAPGDLPLTSRNRRGGGPISSICCLQKLIETTAAIPNFDFLSLGAFPPPPQGHPPVVSPSGRLDAGGAGSDGAGLGRRWGRGGRRAQRPPLRGPTHARGVALGHVAVPALWLLGKICLANSVNP